MAIDWSSVWVPTVSLVELILRTTVVYLFILTALRILRRDVGELSTADVLVIVLVADAAQNAMAAEYKSITEGLVIIATIFGWNYLIDWLAFRYRWAHRLLYPRPVPLVTNGRIRHRNLRAELLRVEDLKSQLREHGVDDVASVKSCRLEADGRLSVVKLDQ